MVDDVVVSEEFRIRSAAFLLTYNRKHDPDVGQMPFNEKDFKELITFLLDREPTELSASLEVGKANNFHLHAYFSKKTDCTLRAFVFQGVTPNCRLNVTRGKGKFSSTMRGHYYAGIARKIRVVCNFSTLVNNDRFDLMQSKWASDLVRQGKMTADDGVRDLFQ